MANFLLIHGAWQGSWVWPAVSANLTMRGHQVHTLDLPGNGCDQTPLTEVSLASYTAAIIEHRQPGDAGRPQHGRYCRHGSSGAGDQPLTVPE